MPIKYFKFLIAGAPSFLIAVPLNYFLVETVLIGPSVAYFIVLMVQVAINFMMLYFFVFNSHNEDHFFVKFYKFFIGIMGIRIIDWLFYSIVVIVFDVYYILMQIINVFLFSLLKYKLSESVIEK